MDLSPYEECMRECAYCDAEALYILVDTPLCASHRDAALLGQEYAGDAIVSRRQWFAERKAERHEVEVMSTGLALAAPPRLAGRLWRVAGKPLPGAVHIIGAEGDIFRTIVQDDRPLHAQE